MSVVETNEANSLMNLSDWFLVYVASAILLLFCFSIRRRHTRCALVTGVQTCALPILLHLPVGRLPVQLSFALQFGDRCTIARRFVGIERGRLFPVLQA